MTKEQLRAELKTVEMEIALAIKYERGPNVTLPVKVLERWRRRVFELEEDDLLWS